MKKIIQPIQKEKAEYFSDFSNKSFNCFGPEAEIKFEFNYGSEFDGSSVEFHLTGDEAKHILDFIRMNLSEGKITELKNKSEQNKKDYDDNMDARDWEQCDRFGNCVNLYQYLLNDNHKS
jgi:1,4-alpha-glucan branching enzyme